MKPITLFHKLAPLGYVISESTNNRHIVLTVPRKPTTAETAAFHSRWSPELRRVPAHLHQFLVAYALAATEGDHQHYKRDPGKNRRIWRTFDTALMTGPNDELYADHGLFALTLPTARQMSGFHQLNRTQLLSSIELQFAMIAGLAQTMLEKYENDPLKAAIALHTGYLEPAFNDFRVGHRGNFAENFIAYFNSGAEWHQINQQGENHEHQTDTASSGTGNPGAENG